MSRISIDKRRPRPFPAGPQSDFSRWLRELRMAPENKVPPLVRWVDRFLRLRKSKPKDTWQDVQRLFLEDLIEGQTPDWQIRQAGDAVQLYCSQFLPSTGAQREAPVDPPPNRDAALSEMRRLLRLRRYSPCTERSYLGWTNRFWAYRGDNRTTTPTPEDAKAFLSYLATRAKVSASAQNQEFSARPSRRAPAGRTHQG